ncbi:MAG TPA: VWA domain-containing protein [Candidatus Polarisedimenticolaceae bacterium]|nr:VWA domain-containing protein [Candidatus Polarisedimenticolaceae bacterium]
MKPTRWIAFALLGPLVVRAGDPPSPSPSPLAVPGVERVEVRLAEFDVVVRDKAGKIIRGLKPENFRVVEDGVPLEIVAVDEWGQTSAAVAPTGPKASPSPSIATEGAPPASASERKPDQRSIIIVFDALGSSTALRMSQAKSAAQKFVRAHTGPGDLVAVYQLDLSLRAISGLTSNAEATAKAIERVAWMPGSSLQDDISESVLGYDARGTNPLAQERLTGLSGLATNQLDWQRNHVYQSLDGLAQVFANLPGKRILVLASPGFPLTTAGDLRLQTSGFTPKFQNLLRTLSRFGVTAYTLDIGDDLSMGDATQKIDWRVAAGKMGMDENVLTDLGLERSLGTGSASARREFLGVLANESGGRMLTSTDLSRDFETIQEESTHFYRVACRVPVGNPGRYKRTLLTVDVAGAKVSSRRGHYSDALPLDRAATTPLATTTESMAAYRPLSSRGAALPLPSADPRKIPVAIVVEAVGPIEIKTSSEGSGALDVEFRLVARADGEVVARYDRAFTTKIRPEGLPTLKDAWRVEGRLALVPGIYEIQGSLRVNDPPQLATWSSTIAVPPPPAAALAITGAYLAADGPKASTLLNRPEIPANTDPLALSDGSRVLLPATTTDFDADQALLLVGWLRNVPLVEGKPRVNLGVHVIDATGKAVDAPTELLQFAPEATGGHRLLARIGAGGLPSGSYALRVEASPQTGEANPVRRTIPFTVHARSETPTRASSAP